MFQNYFRACGSINQENRNEKNKRVGWRRGKFIWQFYRWPLTVVRDVLLPRGQELEFQLYCYFVFYVV